MKELVDRLNRVFDNRIRLALMSILVVNDSMDFNSIKQTLNLTDGNLAAHMMTLENRKYVKVAKKFVGRKTLTTYSLTQAGRKAFGEHIDALEKLIRQSK